MDGHAKARKLSTIEANDAAWFNPAAPQQHRQATHVGLGGRATVAPSRERRLATRHVPRPHLGDEYGVPRLRLQRIWSPPLVGCPSPVADARPPLAL